MKIRFLSPAINELKESIEYYESKEEGLGDRFYIEFRNTIERIKNYPEAWPKFSQHTRRCRTKIFPYGVIYQLRDDEILILAVCHLRREPGYWTERLQK